MERCRGCEAFPKCTAQSYGDATCRYLRFSYGMDDRTEMTNADRIRAMSDEELAKCIYEIGFDCHLCSEHERLSDNPFLCNEKCDEKCVEHCLEWLKQPVEDGEVDAAD